MKRADIDAARREYRRTVNMTFRELQKWSNDWRSGLASMSRAPIWRNLRLLARKASDWTAQDARDALRTIRFIKRMRKVRQGPYVVETRDRKHKLSKRDIALRNWAFDIKKTTKRKRASSRR